MIELVVFDMAGTTVYDGDAVNVCLQRSLQALGVEVTRDQVNAVMGLRKPDAIREMLLSQSGTEDDIEVMVVSAFSNFQELMLDYYTNDPSVKPVAGAEDVFRTLRQRGIKVALDTGFDRSIVAAILTRLCWNETVIDASVSSDEVVQGRPSPDMILRAMEKTGVADPALVTKVGDTPSDLLEGTNAGCRYVIGVTAGSHTREELEPFPHTHLVSTVADVPPILLSGR